MKGILFLEQKYLKMGQKTNKKLKDIKLGTIGLNNGYVFIVFKVSEKNTLYISGNKTCCEVYSIPYGYKDDSSFYADKFYLNGFGVEDEEII